MVVGAAVPGRAPRSFFIACAVCQVRCTVSPSLPIACASDDIAEIAPMSCDATSSAAIVLARTRLSAKPSSAGTFGLRWCATRIMSSCSSTVLTVNGRVGVVDDGRTFRPPRCG